MMHATRRKRRGQPTGLHNREQTTWLFNLQERVEGFAALVEQDKFVEAMQEFYFDPAFSKKPV